MSTLPSVPIQRLAHMAATLDRLSSNRRASGIILEQLGIDPALLEQRDGQIDIGLEAAFCERASKMSGHEAFGALAGLSLQSVSTLTNYIAKYSRDLKSAIEAASRYYVLTNPTTVFWLQTSSTTAAFQMRCEVEELNQNGAYREFSLASAIAVMRRITGVSFYPLEVRFKHPAPAHSEVLKKLLGCPVVFDAPLDEIQMAPSTLNLVIPTYDPALRDHLVNYGELLLAQAPISDQGLRGKIEKLLLDGLPGRLPSADEIAANLGMSRRTFARRLSDSGVSFREIVDRLREDLARRYLCDGLPISEVAYVLDYSDQAAFTTAFKRWTGATPKAFAMQAAMG